VPAASNGEAAQRASARKNCAAIASRRAASLHKLTVLAENIEDAPSNITRFIVLSGAAAKPTGADKTSLVCAVPNTPGALTSVLAVFSKHSVNMVKLESRPARNQTWEYMFYIDIEGHQQDTAVAAALRQFKKHAAFVKIVGSYPKDVTR
jgi:chorismate mutase/prephenate dehydratase